MGEPLETDPLSVLTRWVGEAGAAGLPVPSAMTFATSGPDGPNARMVLATAVGPDALRFHSSLPTTKTRDLAADPRASAVFHWPTLGRQAVLTGRAALLDATVSAAAYPDRPLQLRLLAWTYDELLPRLKGPRYEVAPGAVEQAFDAAAADPRSVAAPPSWTTITFTPHRVDFWQAGTETTPPTKTRYERSGTGWRSFPVLP
jgi:pyridoxamine 5'-phosphate oxidase